MPELSFAIAGAHALNTGIEPAIGLRTQIAVTPAETHVYSLSLRYQVQIDAALRRYTSAEQQRLIKLFGHASGWNHTLRSLPWVRTAAQVPAFIGQTQVDLPLPCRAELSPAIETYFEALDQGHALLLVQFSGAGFFAADNVPLQMAPVPGDRPATFRLPLGVWREAAERKHQPDEVLHLV